MTDPTDYQLEARSSLEGSWQTSVDPNDYDHLDVAISRSLGATAEALQSIAASLIHLTTSDRSATIQSIQGEVRQDSDLGDPVEKLPSPSTPSYGRLNHEPDLTAAQGEEN